MSPREKKLSPEDQAKVDSFLKEGYNDVERKAFRPGLLFVVLFVILLLFSAVSFLVARSVGVV